MFQWDTKLIVVGGLMLVLVAVKLLAGGRPYDRPVRRPRRFGFRGTHGPLGPQAPPRAEPPPVDPEKEFFGEDGRKR